MFPSDILLEVFDFCHPEPSETRDESIYNWWHGLVHVCRRWRQIIFTSSRWLNLQLLCTPKSPAGNLKDLDTWPQIPIAIKVEGLGNHLNPTQEDNLLTAFEHSDRVCSVTANLLIQPQLEMVVKMMLKPFPALTYLRLSIKFETFDLRILPSGFLGGPSPGLQELDLSCISSPALPSILSSTSNLVALHLRNFPMTNHISTEAMAKHLAVMTKLESLTIEFNHYYMHHFPALNVRARATLPTLTQFQFRGPHWYLENLVAQLDTPRLFDLTVIILIPQTRTQATTHPVVQQFPQLFPFIDRAEDIKLSHFGRACVEIHNFRSFVRFDNPQHPAYLTLGEGNYDHTGLDYDKFRPFWAMRPLLGQASAVISSVRHLSITRLDRRWTGWDIAGFLRLLRSFVVMCRPVSSSLTCLRPVLVL